MKWYAHHKKMEGFLKTRKHLAPATRMSYRKALQRFADYCNHVESYGVEIDYLVEHYVKHLKDTGCSGKTIQLYLTILRIFFRASLNFESKYRYRIQYADKKAAKIRAAKRWFTDEEIEACRNYTFPKAQNWIRNQVIVNLLIDTGARCKEISRIRLNDINLDENTVFISDSKTEPRSVFFSDRTKDILSEYIRMRTMTIRYKLFPATVKDIVLFPSVRAIKALVDIMLIDLGLKRGADGRGPHAFRHYVATWLHYEGGMSIMDIAFLLGDTPSTIQRFYIHPTAKMLQRRVNQSMWWGKRQKGVEDEV